MRSTTRMWRLVGMVALLAAAGCGGSSDGAPVDRITVAAASDLRFAFGELGDSFTADTGIEVTFSFGSSGLLREQIINGAPFDLYASANVEFVDAVVAAGRGDPDTQQDYALGRIVLWSRPGTDPPRSVADLAHPDVGRIAIANPQHAPYGQAALEALHHAGVHDEVADRLVYGENISDTLRIVESGNASVGIVALSLAIVTDVDYEVVPEDHHRPLRQALVVTATDERGDSARRFAAYVASTDGRAVMERHGFVLPDEDR